MSIVPPILQAALSVSVLLRVMEEELLLHPHSREGTSKTGSCSSKGSPFKASWQRHVALAMVLALIPVQPITQN